MPRAKTILQSESPYNLTGRCINREWFNIPMDRVWEIFCQELNRTNLEYNLIIHSFVLMSNHFHLIASTPHANISQCMHQFMMNTSRLLTREGNRINETFAGRHYKCILHDYKYFLNAYKYNYRNPVSAGICDFVEDYKYSSLNVLLGNSPPILNLMEDITLKSDPVGTLKWLNTAPDPKKLEGVRYALKRQYFTTKKCPITRKPMIDKNDIL